MLIGMLWYDNDPKSTLSEKIARAAAYYTQKYGRRPNTCFVNTATASEPAAVDGIQVRSSKQVNPNHFWLGVQER